MAATPTKQRIVEAGAELFRHKGYTGTGVKEIVTAAQAPFGSLYHHFPGGKEQLGEAVIRWSGAKFGELGPAVLGPAPEPVTGVRTFFTQAGEHLAESGWADACPIATVALEVASTSEPLRVATHDVFEGWLAGLEAYFAAHGIAAGRARELAVAMIAALEGAFVLARAARSTEALDVAGGLIADAVAAALP